MHPLVGILQSKLANIFSRQNTWRAEIKLGRSKGYGICLEGQETLIEAFKLKKKQEKKASSLV